MAAFELLAALVALFAALYYYMTSTADYWAKRGVPFLEPTPFFGNTKEFIFSTEFRGVVGQRFYNYAKERGHKYLGVFFGRRPALIIQDVELVKTIMVRDFQYFMDHGVFFDRKREPLSANLFNLRGPEWKTMRGKLSPTFTTGKMKAMFYLVRACAEDLENYLAKESAESNDLDIAEIMAKFSTDVIGTCAFGVEANSLKDPNAEFRTMGRKVFDISPFRALLAALAETAPPLRRLLPVPLIKKEVSQFFTSTLSENMRHREQSNIVRHDFVDLLMQLRNKSGAEGTGIDESTLPAQAFVFFLAGFETSAGATSSCFLQLAKHPDVQDRLREEVDRVLAKHGGQISYEALQEMTYMEQVLEETMRLFPALGLLPRMVTREYTLPDSKATLSPGTRVIIPIYALHHDPEFWPEPHRFDPDRFTEENKKNRPHFAYLPFGEGPRICIGLRFAWMQMKTVLSTVLRSYVVTPSEHSVYPLKFEPKSFVTKAKGGVRIQLKRRSVSPDAPEHSICH